VVPTVSAPALWSILYGNDNGSVSIVVPEDASPVTALRVLVEENYGGEFSPDNPVIASEAAGKKIEVWRECSRAQIEDDGIDSRDYDNWWAPHGAGREIIHVLTYDGSLFDLGQRAEAAEAP
jgi:hypothetical protein